MIHINMNKSICNYLIALPVIAAAFLSFLYLGNKSLWLDEVYSVSFAGSSWKELLDIVTNTEANMSLYYSLLKIWVGFFGDSEFAARSLSAVFAIFSVIVIYAIGTRLFGIRTGLAAAALLSVNAFFIHYAQEAKTYSLTLLLSACSMYLFILCVEKQQYRYFIAHGLLNGLILYTHFLAAFVFIAQLISLAFLPARAVQWKKVITSALLTGLLASPLAFFILNNLGLGNWVPKSSLKDIYGIFWVFAGKSKLLLTFYFISCLPALLIFLNNIYHLKRNIITWRYSLLLCWLFVPIFGIYILSIFKPIFVNRYLLPSLPGLALLAGAGLPLIRFRAFSAVITAMLVIFSIHSLFYIYYPEEKSGYKAATKYIVGNQKQGDAIFFYSTFAKVPFEYYYTKMNNRKNLLTSVYPFPIGTPVYVHLLNAFTNTRPDFGMIESLPEKYKRLWVVLAYDKLENIGLDSGPVVRMIEKKYSIFEYLQFTDVNVRLYKIEQ